MRPEDVLKDDENFLKKDGVPLRKGSVAAFIANAKTFLDKKSSQEARVAAEKDMVSLLPTLTALGLFDVFEIKSQEIRKLMGL